jgi:hypothetical protein
MSDIALVKDEELGIQDELLTTAEIAERDGVSERTVRNQMKELGFLACGVKKNAQGSDSPLYAYRSWKKFSDFSGLSAEGQVLYLYGAALKQITMPGEPGVEAAKIIDTLAPGLEIGTLLRDTFFEVGHHKAIRRNLEAEVKRITSERHYRQGTTKWYEE